MAATVIDALLVTLGLDTSDFRKGQKDVSDDLKKQREDAKKTAKEMAEQGKKAAAFFGSIKTELLALTGVTVTAGGLMSLVKNTTSSLMDLSIQSKALGMSAKELDGWAKSAEAAGSSAEKITNVLKGFQDAKQGATFGDFTNPLYEVAPILRRLTGVEINTSKDDVPTIARKVFSALQKVKNPAMRRVLAERVGIDDATLQRNQEGQFLPDVDRLTKSSGITDASTKGAKEFTAAWAELGQNLDTVKNQIYEGLIPTIRDLNGLLKEWSSGNVKSSSFFKELKRDINDITGIDLGSWTLSSDLRNLKDNFSMLGKVLNHLGNALNELNNGNFTKAADEFKKAWYGTEDGKPTGNDALPGVTSNSQSIYENSTYKKYNDLLNKYLPEWLGGTPSDRKKDQDEKSYWDTTKTLLSKIADAIVTPAGASSLEPSIGGISQTSRLTLRPLVLALKERLFFRQWLVSSARWKVNMDFLPVCCLR